jgi:UPF0716 protein FxsA
MVTVRRVLTVAAVLAVPLAELWVFIWAVQRFGWAAVLVVAALVFGLGIAMIRMALVGWGDAANRASQDRVYRQDRFNIDFASATLLFVGGVLMVIPGFLTAIAGLILVLPPVRSWLSGSFGARLTKFTADRGYQRVVIIEGETVPQPAEPPEASDASDTTIIIGEILPPEDDQKK